MIALDLQSHRNIGQGLFVVTTQFNLVIKKKTPSMK